MKKAIGRLMNRASLSVKIRLSYLLIMVPFLALLIISVCINDVNTRRYNEMINSAALASEFSLDFKSDFDYETYLLIVGNKKPEESRLNELLEEATRVVDGLGEITSNSENKKRIDSVKKYLANLSKYKSRIEKNLGQDYKYEDNIEIWENDVQIVTTLIREEIFQYVFIEIRDMQAAREDMALFSRRVEMISIIAILLVTASALIFSFYIPESISKPINNLVEVTEKISKGDLSVRAVNIDADTEVGVLSESMNSMIDKINLLLEQIKEEQIHIREAELELLQAQINPHFLYNTLDAIVWLAEGGKQKEVASMVKSLSQFFRISLSRGRDSISLSEEIEHAGSYLEIQQFRYRDILTYDIDIPEEYRSCILPKITIQPLIENAIYHGIKTKRGGGRIRIYAKSEDENLAIYVEDNGMGMSEERLDEVMNGIRSESPGEHSIYGLYNVNERLRLKFGNEYGLSIESEYGKSTTVKILIPRFTHSEKIQLCE